MLQPRPSEEHFNRFLSLLDRYESFAAQAGVTVCRAPRDEAQRLFETLDETRRTQQFERLELELSIFENALEAGESLFDSPRLLWRYLMRLGGVPCSDIFDKIGDGDVVEVFSIWQQLCYVNFKFFERVSFTLEQVFTLLWHDATSRDSTVATKMRALAARVLSGELTGTLDPGIGWHEVEEVGSARCLKTEMHVKWLSPVYTNHKVSGLIVVLARR